MLHWFESTFSTKWQIILCTIQNKVHILILINFPGSTVGLTDSKVFFAKPFCFFDYINVHWLMLTMLNVHWWKSHGFLDYINVHWWKSHGFSTQKNWQLCSPPKKENRLACFVISLFHNSCAHKILRFWRTCVFPFMKIDEHHIIWRLVLVLV